MRAARSGATTDATVILPPVWRWVIAVVAAAAVPLVPLKASLAAIGLVGAALLSFVPLDVLLVLLVGASGVNLQPGLGAESGPGGLELNAARLLLVLATVGVIAIRRPSIGQHLKAIWIYVVFALFAGLSLAWTSDRIEGIRFLLQLLFPIAVFCLTCEVVQRLGVDYAFRSLALGASIGLAVNFVASLTQEWWALGGDFARYYGTLAPNPLGLFSAALGLAAFGFSRWYARLPLLTLFVLCTAQLAATGSRTSLVSLGIALALLQLVRGRWKSIVAIFLCGIGLWLAVPALGTRPGVDVESGVGASAASLVQESNLSGRLFIWYDVWTAMIAGAEGIGRGLGSSTAFMEARYQTLRSTHSEVLRLVAEVGAIGLTLFVLAVAQIAGRLLRRAREADEKARDLAHVGLSALLLLAMTCMTENALSGYMYFVGPIWVMIGLAIAFKPTDQTRLHVRT